MVKLPSLTSSALLAAGALLGWTAATGQWSLSKPVQASATVEVATESTEQATPQKPCCDKDAGVQLALANHNIKVAAAAEEEGRKPNILIIWGDDIGVHNISAYNHGIMGYQTPNIDRLAKEGALFTDAYGEQSCTAGRAAFILGQHPFRTGLLTIGMPGSEHGIPDFAPTIADLLKNHGYATAQYGKNHLGDRDKHLPTAHGFDEFFGNLYHLNAEEEPETYYYPRIRNSARSTLPEVSSSLIRRARSKTPGRSLASEWKRLTRTCWQVASTSSTAR